MDVVTAIIVPADAYLLQYIYFKSMNRHYLSRDIVYFQNVLSANGESLVHSLATVNLEPRVVFLRVVWFVKLEEKVSIQESHLIFSS